jgi:hypothetical protein
MARSAKIKTTETTASVDAFIDGLADEQQRVDSRVVVKLMEKATKAKAKMWGTAIIGFGNKAYVSPKSGRQVDWMKLGFSPRKAALTFYMISGLTNHAAALKVLGKHKIGGGCLYIKRLSDIDLKVLEKMIRVEAES